MPENADLIALTVEVVASFVAHNELPAEDVAEFIRSTHVALAAIASPGEISPAVASAQRKPVVAIRKSLASPDNILSLIDGKPYQSLKRHLRAHGLTPAEYRAAFGLKADYPMVAPAYSERRRAVAVSLGLGRKPGASRGAAAGIRDDDQAPRAEQRADASDASAAGQAGERVLPERSGVAAGQVSGGESGQSNADPVAQTPRARRTLSISV
ncbi:MucR family transcriptional regulator [Flavisphingomonas formosensis]|uniref:MucR family transcriptional regulator n=1 Tax=Flavisphingomonas formosensis TaxID=861534 RepID=UPI0012F99D45|nr:MucR family transcriptional regulator [Sphingomonas formosensis]